MKTLLKWILGLLVLTLICHVCEWFIIGRKVAADANIPVAKALPQCLMRGFLWWKPIKKSMEK